MTVEVVRDLHSLEQRVPAWQDLASDAIEPNVFYEPWMLIPALRSFGAEIDLMFVFIYARTKTNRPGELCGFFPLERKRRLKGLPIPALRFWKHLHCYLTTPLVRATAASKTLRTFFEWSRQNHSGCPILELPHVSGDGPFVSEVMAELWPAECYSRSYTRAIIHSRDDVDLYLKTTLSGDRRREMKRKQRRLNERGVVSSKLICQPSDDPSVVDRFLELEASTWKGKQGVALACDQKNREFLSTIAAEGMARKQLQFSCLSLDDRAIAMSCDLLSPPGCFAFKIAFDKDYSSFAPGIQLALNHIHLVHAREDIKWMDSCTSAGSTWVRGLWADKKTVTSILVPLGMMGSDLTVALFPLLRWMKHKICRVRTSSDNRACRSS